MPARLPREGTEFAFEDLLEALPPLLRHVEGLALRRGLAETMPRPERQALAAVTALLAAAGARCRQGPPGTPPSDIEMVTDTNGSLIYECGHDPAHRWRKDGTPLP